MITISATRADEAAPDHVDVCVYGSTSGGVMAAVEAKKMGRTVLLISPTTHLGGMTSSGLGFTDVGNPHILGGLAHDFFHRLWTYYQSDSAWTWQKRSDFLNKGQGGPALNDKTQLAITFEPHVAESVFNQYIAENKIPVVHARLDLNNGVVKDGAKITAIRTEDGHEHHADVFIDATYEGDLMAKAGVSYAVGREPNSQYGETINGIEVAKGWGNQLPPGINPYVVKDVPTSGLLPGIDPYVTKGDKSSGLLPGVNPDPGGADGTGDKRIQAYCYRMCLTDVPENRVPIEKPPGYNAADYELLFRAIEVDPLALDPKKGLTRMPNLVPNRKTDTNNFYGVSTDFIGKNYEYPDADYAARAKMEEAHKNWQLGLMWTLVNNARIPQPIRDAFKPWGLAKDEFTDNGNWPPQIYVREARRMVSDFVETEPLLRNTVPTARSIGMGSYTLDSHNVQRIVNATGHVSNEGDVQETLKGIPYKIDYGSIVPRAKECENLLVPVCLSASHIAYGSIRMEPVFMILGQSAGTAAAMAVENHEPVQQVDYEKLKAQLVADGQVLE